MRHIPSKFTSPLSLGFCLALSHAGPVPDQSPSFPHKDNVDMGHVYVRELPDMRVDTPLPNGHSYNRHSYEGYYVFDDPNSLLNDRAFYGVTAVLYKPKYDGQPFRRQNILYQYSLSQGNDKEGNQIWMLGEFNPPGLPMQWIVATTGKRQSENAEGMWHWNWPEMEPQSLWPNPGKPTGYDYPNAEEFYYAPTPDDKSVYWIDTPPIGLGSNSIERDTSTPRIHERGVTFYSKKPGLNQNRDDVPGGFAFEQDAITGVYLSDNPYSIFHNRDFTGMRLALYKPAAKGERFSADNAVREFFMIQTSDHDGDHLWLWGEHIAPDKPKWIVKKGTGKFEGLVGQGTWLHEFPTDRSKPEGVRGTALATDFEFLAPKDFRK